jgi:hypothetical protein
MPFSFPGEDARKIHGYVFFFFTLLYRPDTLRPDCGIKHNLPVSGQLGKIFS